MAALVILALAVVLGHRGPGDLQGATQRLALSGFGVFYVGGLMVGLPLMHRDLRRRLALGDHRRGGHLRQRHRGLFHRPGAGAAQAGPRDLARARQSRGPWAGWSPASLFMFLARATFFPALTAVDAIVIGVVAGILGPTGDLLESMIKRAAGAKDSGRLIPGHGGILDRIDAVLFVGAFVYAYAVFLRRLGGFPSSLGALGGFKTSRDQVADR